MGLLSSCSNVLLRLFAFGPATEQYYNQQPLPLGDITLNNEKGIDPHLETGSPGFTCQYPSMKGWETCNGPDSRDCWLKDTYSNQPVFSQYESVVSTQDKACE